MANERFIDYANPGPFLNLPLITQLRVSPGSQGGGQGGAPGGSLSGWGKNPDANYDGMTLLDPDKVIPQFAFTDTPPTTGGFTLRNNYVYAFTAGGTNRTTISIAPLFKAVMKFTGGGSITTNTNFFGAGGGYEFCFEHYNNTRVGGGTYPGQTGVLPLCAYIFRPSTSSVVSWLWDSTTQQYNSWAVNVNHGTLFNVGRNQKWATIQCQWIYGNSTWPFNYDCESGAIWNATVQAGDYLVVEWFTVWQPGSATAATMYQAYHDITAVFGHTRTYAGGTAVEENSSNQGSRPLYRFVVPAAYTIPDPATGGGGGTTPVLTNVDPTTGPRVRLTFNNPVIAGGDSTTIGPASSGLGVTSVEQIDDTTVDLHTDYPPTHPLGEAEDVTPPDENVRHW